MFGVVGNLPLLHFHLLACELAGLQQHCGLMQSALSLQLHVHGSIMCSL